MRTILLPAFLIPALFLMLGLLSCRPAPLPEDRQDYFGSWEAEDRDASMIIHSHGKLVFIEKSDWGRTHVTSTPVYFDGDDLIAGIWIFSSRYKIERPPFIEGEHWVLIANGERFIRDYRPPRDRRRRP